MTEPKLKRTGLLLAVLIAVGLAAGIGLGLILGWIVWPVSYTNTTLTDLSTADKENYIVLVAAALAVAAPRLLCGLAVIDEEPVGCVFHLLCLHCITSL